MTHRRTVLEMASNLTFVVLLLLVAQGWTVTVYANREKYGLIGVLGLYTVMSIVVFIVATVTTDPASTKIAFQVSRKGTRARGSTREA